MSECKKRPQNCKVNKELNPKNRENNSDACTPEIEQAQKQHNHQNNTQYWYDWQSLDEL